jgi:hypothetical protein
MKFKHPELIVPYVKESKRDRAYPFVLGLAVALLIILVKIKGVK